MYFSVLYDIYFFATTTTSELMKNVQTESSTIKFTVYLYTGTRNIWS